MQCFNHTDSAAVGICKYCMKAVCRDCFVLVGPAVSCKGDCETKVRSINSVQEKQLRLVNVALFVQKLLSILAVLYGIYMVFSWSGFDDYPLDRGLVGVGIAFIVFGVLVLRRVRKLRSDA